MSASAYGIILGYYTHYNTTSIYHLLSEKQVTYFKQAV